jgi:hypothetical protein
MTSCSVFRQLVILHIYITTPITDSFGEGVAVVGKNNKYGIINKKGKAVVPLKYDSIFSFDEGMMLADKNGKLGLIDKSGNIKAQCHYDSIYLFSEGKAPVEKSGKWALLCLY